MQPLLSAHPAQNVVKRRGNKMALLLGGLAKAYKKIFENADPRVENYILMNSPVGVLSLVFFYIFFIFRLGPLIMKGRQPLDIRKIVKIYNISQIVFNSIGVYWGTTMLIRKRWTCIPIDYSDSPDANSLILMHYLYFLLKLYDLLDTLFFILRKKFSQVTFLHCYHHASMALGTWATLKFVPGGQLLSIGYVNVIIHVAMYFYYYLTAADPSNKKNIWWKKYITQMQLVQHCIILSTCVASLLDSSCTYPKIVLLAYMPQAILFIYLFSDFYYKAYIKSPVKTD